MDLSKLPRMSDTRRGEVQRLEEQKAATSDRPPATADAIRDTDRGGIEYGRPVAVDVGAGSWISIIVGALLILLAPRFWQYLLHLAFGTSFAPFIDAAGNTVPYPQTLAFWGDLAIALFAVALLFEGVVLMALATHRAAIWASLVVVALATLVNLGYLIYAGSQGYTREVFSILAVLFGAFMCYQQWQLLFARRRRYLIVE